MKILAVVGALLFVTLGCQTMAPPGELSEAREEIKRAERADVDDLMPSSMELAHRQLDRAETLWEESQDRRDENAPEEADTLEKQAIDMAISARDIAKTGTDVKQQVASWDEDPRQYAMLKRQASSSEDLTAQYEQLMEQNAQAAAAAAAAAAEQPEEEGLAQGEVLEEVPLAYFETAATEVREADQDAIASAAQFLKENETAAVVLKGHADPRGSAERNQALARQRAEAVAEALRAEGVAEEQITVGEPVVTSAADTEQGGPADWQLDRKVSATFETGVAH